MSYFYLSGKGLDSYLVQFINDKEESLFFDHDSLDDIFKNDLYDFLGAVVSCNSLTNQKYSDILNTLGLSYNSFSDAEVEDEKVSILIKLGIIPMRKQELLFMREAYPRHCIYFITHNISQYTEEVIDKVGLPKEEVISILNEDVDDEYK